MSFDGSTWTLLSDQRDLSPLPFDQRFVGVCSDAADVIEGAWERSDDGIAWSEDFKVVHMKIGRGSARKEDDNGGSIRDQRFP